MTEKTKEEIYDELFGEDEKTKEWCKRFEKAFYDVYAISHIETVSRESEECVKEMVESMERFAKEGRDPADVIYSIVLSNIARKHAESLLQSSIKH